jgi:methylated-DNA-protein-cysteine methyltransferase-like protein
MRNAFFEGVYEIVAAVPRGRVVSYGRIAAMLGNPRAARQVGWAMRVCPDELPWHRVVMKDGSITGGECAVLRRGMLEDENITFLPDGRVDMELHRWDG